MDGTTDLKEFFMQYAPKDNRRRTMNALVRGGIATMEKLCAVPDEKLRRVRNLGDKCFQLSHDMRDLFIEIKNEMTKEAESSFPLRENKSARES